MKSEDNSFDIIVIGAGSGGLNIAGFMNRIGLRVLLIDKSEANIGGDCLNYGCVPSKALIHVAREIYAGKQSEAFGLTVDGEVDLKQVLQYVKEKQDVFREHESVEYFRKIGMTVVIGEARFQGKRSLTVNGVEYIGKKIVIATGSRPRKFELPGTDGVPVYTNETVFDMTALPQKFVFVGGGPISLELGQAFSMLGSEVTIVHGGTKLLEKEDPDVGTFMKAELEAMGVRVLLSARPIRYENGTLIVMTPQGETVLPADALFSGIGRVLNIEDLALDKAGINLTPDGSKILVDSYLRTTNENAYTVGDVAGGLQFTHAAELHARLILRNFFSPFKKKLDTDSFGWVTYTTPEVATFGLAPSEFTKRSIAFETISSSLEEDDRAIVDGSRGFIKLFIGKNGMLLGGTLVAPQAGEIVGELLLAKSKNLTITDLFNRVAPYPTASRIIRRVASQHEAKKLTPGIQRLLHVLYRYF